MARVTAVEFEFVDSAPAQLRLGTLYVSTKYRAIVHLCLCGCGEKVLLNLDPDAWSFTFDGRSISIHDSVGNIGLPCRSHYIVRRNRVEWLRPLNAMDPNLALAGREPRKVELEPPAKSGWFSRLFKRDR
jgi:hypothetical protein